MPRALVLGGTTLDRSLRVYQDDMSRVGSPSSEPYLRLSWWRVSSFISCKSTTRAFRQVLHRVSGERPRSRRHESTHAVPTRRWRLSCTVKRRACSETQSTLKHISLEALSSLLRLRRLTTTHAFEMHGRRSALGGGPQLGRR
eukprot:6204006-Pleurochrysis_carterae.AAC.1